MYKDGVLVGFELRNCIYGMRWMMDDGGKLRSIGLAHIDTVYCLRGILFGTFDEWLFWRIAV